MGAGPDGARQANRRGVAHLLAGELHTAEACFVAALAASPNDASAWFNLSLVHKRRRHWREVARCSERAAQLAGGRNEAAWWNAGIAATALHDWDRARAAWRQFGLEVDAGGGPVVLPMGLIALAAVGAPPVLATRLDPARARILGPPPPMTALAHHDVVLCDAEPVGELRHDGQTVRVVEVLELWHAEPRPRGRVTPPSRGA